MNSDRLIGLAHVAARVHGGQWCRWYRILSRIDWRPRGGAERLLPRDEWSEARRWAAHYLKFWRGRSERARRGELTMGELMADRYGDHAED